MSRTKSGILTGVLICLPLTAGIQPASAHMNGDEIPPPPGGTLDPTLIPKYISDLVIPPVLYDDKGGHDPLQVNVAQREFKQRQLPSKGCRKASRAQVAAGGPRIRCQGDAFPKTKLWGYGNPEDPKTFFNPSFTFEVTKDTPTTVRWINELVRNPERCFDDGYYAFGDGTGMINGKASNNNKAKGKKKGACRFLKHVIQDQKRRPIIDQTLHWAAPNQDCREGQPRPDCRGASDKPYTGPIPMVVHVHGAHVGPGSDGYPEAWWLPKASNIPKSYATNGTFFESAEGADTLNALGQGYAIDMYSNDQPTTTLFYHDHTLGITRLNVYAAGAGFWMIRDAHDGETGLLHGKLPGPAPTLGNDPNCLKGKKCNRKHIREIPLAIQPKSFNADGSQFYPADRAFFEGLGDGDIFIQNTGLDIPFLPGANSDIAPAWNPEAFFNTMVVNGLTWPKLDVAQALYRFRMVNAADGRWLNMALHVVKGPGPDRKMGTADDVLGRELPFYQIGAEQGLLPKVVRIETDFATQLPGNGHEVGSGVKRKPGRLPGQALLIGPAERADVIVDFSGLPNGAMVRMINTGPDEPFGGDFGVVNLDTTYQVMQFEVKRALNQKSDRHATHPKDLVLDRNPGGVPKFKKDQNTRTRDLALLEEESALICVATNMTTGEITRVAGTPPNCPEGSEPFGPQAAVLGTNGRAGGTVQLWDDPIRQNPQVDDIETWELWNWSADAHPIHLHLVKFQVLGRKVIGFDDAGEPILDAHGNATTVKSLDPEPWEMGWKDTVTAYPGEVTLVKAQFDIPGLYVWHCHLLSHEDNEMMVPYCVGDIDACSPIPAI